MPPTSLVANFNRGMIGVIKSHKYYIIEEVRKNWWAKFKRQSNAHVSSRGDIGHNMYSFCIDLATGWVWFDPFPKRAGQGWGGFIEVDDIKIKPNLNFVEFYYV
ncbi:hypothetical protein CR513_18700, partial [Mucuna pruriens]